MTYVMSKEMYKEYTTDKKGYKGLTHEELLVHINKAFGIRGEIKHIKIEG